MSACQKRACNRTRHRVTGTCSISEHVTSLTGQKIRHTRVSYSNQATRCRDADDIAVHPCACELFTFYLPIKMHHCWCNNLCLHIGQAGVTIGLTSKCLQRFKDETVLWIKRANSIINANIHLNVTNYWLMAHFIADLESTIRRV